MNQSEKCRQASKNAKKTRMEVKKKNWIAGLCCDFYLESGTEADWERWVKATNEHYQANEALKKAMDALTEAHKAYFGIL